MVVSFSQATRLLDHGLPAPGMYDFSARQWQFVPELFAQKLWDGSPFLAGAGRPLNQKLPEGGCVEKELAVIRACFRLERNKNKPQKIMTKNIRPPHENRLNGGAIASLIPFDKTLTMNDLVNRCRSANIPFRKFEQNIIRVYFWLKLHTAFTYHKTNTST